jgi:hypothetical protein
MGTLFRYMQVRGTKLEQFSDRYWCKIARGRTNTVRTVGARIRKSLI